jgi:hypothetical protein
MAINTLIRFILRNPILLVLRMNKTLNEFYRAGFISTAISEGIYDLLSKGRVSAQDIQNNIGSHLDSEGLEAWLDFGVSIGELNKKNDEYSLRSSFSKKLLKPGKGSFHSTDESLVFNDRWFWPFALSGQYL